MYFRRLKHMLLRLSAEEKVIGIGSLLTLAGTFMPWYTVITTFDETMVTESGLSGDLGVVGFVIFLMTLLAMLVLVGEHLHIRLPQFGYKKEQLLFFLMGQSAFLTLLDIGIYLKRSLEYTQANLRFGIFVSFAGAFFAAFAAFALIQKNKEKETRAFFGYEPETIDHSKNPEEGINEITSSQTTSQEDHYQEPSSLFHNPDETDEKMVNQMPRESSQSSINPEGEEGDIKTNQAHFFGKEAGIK